MVNDLNGEIKQSPHEEQGEHNTQRTSLLSVFFSFFCSLEVVFSDRGKVQVLSRQMVSIVLSAIVVVVVF